MACLTTNRRRRTETAEVAAIEEVVEARRWVEAAAMSSGERATEAETTLAARGEAASVAAIEVTTATVTVEATTEIAEDREAIEVDEVRRWVGPVVVVVVVVATRRIARHPRLALQQPPSSPTIPLRSTAAVVVEGLRHRGAHHNHNHTAVEEDRHLEELHQQCRTRTAVVRLLHRVAMAARQHLAAMRHRRSSGHLRRTACTQAECHRSLARRLRWATAVRHRQALAAAIPRRQACEAWERRQQSSTCHRQATAAGSYHRSSSSTVADHHHRQVNITNHDSAPMLYSLPLVHTSQYIQLVIQSVSQSVSHFIHRVGWMA